MSNNTNSPTLEFIHLIKCIIEYYATTKDIQSKENIEENIEEAGQEDLKELLDMYKNMDSSNNISINIPGDIDSAIESAFLAHLKFYKNKINNNIKEL
jgi:hypothetical protein